MAPFRGQGAPPQLQQSLRNIRISEGQDAFFQCQLAGNPRPRVSNHQYLEASVTSESERHSNGIKATSRSHTCFHTCALISDPMGKKWCAY